MWRAPQNIDITCMQETHRNERLHEIANEGYLLILSGEIATSETAGVGLLVAPQLRCSVLSFDQYSERLAGLKSRIFGGKMVVCTIYARHSGKPLESRHVFFNGLDAWISKQSRHGPILVMGDLNARLPSAT